MMTLLILAVIVLGLLAVTRLSRVYELTAKLRDKREEEITERDSKMNSRLLWAFPFAYFAFFLWLTLAYKEEMLPVSASEHGVWLDDLLNFNWVILIVVFFITNILLFYFAGKYYYRHDRRAYYYPHNNKWELGWTIVPAVVMIGIIIYGLNVWNRITAPTAPGVPKMELYAAQFNWTARYPGADGQLGATDFRLVNDANNPLGIATPESIEQRLKELAEETAAEKKKLADEGGYMAPARRVELEDHIKHLERMSGRIINLRTMMMQDIKAKGDSSAYTHGADDLVVKEFHLPVRADIEIQIRSRDVIHSAYIPHLRAQMNAVPGMSTLIVMKPTITTDDMRTRPDVIRQMEGINNIRQNEGLEPYTFNYILMCNKICGASHYNMQMPLIVEEEADFKAWLAQQKGFQTAATPAPEEAPAAPDSTNASPTATAEAIMAGGNEPKTN